MNFKRETNSLCLIRQDSGKDVIGTGFVFLKNNWIATARHLIIKGEKLRKNVTVLFGGEEIKIHKYFIHPTFDLGIILLQKEIDTIPLFPSHEKYSGEEGLICYGYAPSKTNNGQSIILKNRIYKYSIEVDSKDKLSEKIILFEAPFAERGHSGGPLLNEGGGVVAIISRDANRNGVKYIKATSIHPLLNELKFNWKDVL